ncbi:nucleoside-diphosphate sugar epimerase/dehydratase [Fodinicurvata sp. EGI_FJ10296]|uniref:polysaccharide biosynthesis protein n=1 Tax=Fodinicurvata sp. EGI_FJ10296 TaxID=3231908 RepID=UPI0034572C4A
MRYRHIFLALCHDLLVTVGALIAALVLRLDGLPDRYAETMIPYGVPGLAVIAAGTFLVFRVYRGIWRFASTVDLMAIIKAATVTVLLFVAFMFVVDRLATTPRSVPIIQWMIMVVLMGGSRFAYRQFHEISAERQAPVGTPRIPILLIGTGDEADGFLRATSNPSASQYQVVGIVSRKRGRVGGAMHDIPVLGHIEEIRSVVDRLTRKRQRPQRVLLTDPANALPHDTAKRLLETCESLSLPLSRLPRLTEFRSAVDLSGLDLQPVALEDLLGRPQAAIDRQAVHHLLTGRVIMVTGGGGSIGSELCRQIASFDPDRLILTDVSEFNLYSIDQAIGEEFPDLPRQAILVDVRNRSAVFATLRTHRPDVIFHAAALKHVPIVETNPIEGIETNCIGTRNVAEAALAVGARAMVQISTDKAVNPTNVMGATKRLAEYFCQALDLDGDDRNGPGRGADHSERTRFMTVRFGNVLGSSGSVVPLFQRQLQRGGPLTVTHPDIRRYFMTISEAVSLVLQAAAHGLQEGDKRGEIFVLDMGEPIKVSDLARHMILLAGLKPDKDVKIIYTGLRPGEKLFEELFDSRESPEATTADGILKAIPRPLALSDLQRAMDRLSVLAASRDTLGLYDVLNAVVPGYEGKPYGLDDHHPGADTPSATVVALKRDH